MSRYRGPITKLSRRLGVILFANGASKSKAFNKKKYKPGMHGQNMRTKASEFGKQLMEKQKARHMYGITEKQSRRYYEEAKKSKSTTGEQYMQLLECRLDNTIFRAGIASTRTQARQVVSHGLIKLNGRKVTVPSIQVKPGDKFEVKENKKESPLFAEVKKGKHTAPSWLKVNSKSLSGEVVREPEIQEIDSIQAINPQLIVEFYSK